VLADRGGREIWDRAIAITRERRAREQHKRLHCRLCCADRKSFTGHRPPQLHCLTSEATEFACRSRGLLELQNTAAATNWQFQDERIRWWREHFGK